MASVKLHKENPDANIKAGERDPVLEKSLLSLEDVCVRALDARFPSKDDADRLIWLQRFKNIVTNISLAMAEVKGPRCFHQHYRHDRKDSKKLLPVLENPLEQLAHSCEFALQELAKKLDTHESDLISAQRQVEAAVRKFLALYQRQNT